nr:hypothetical protein [Mesorhizobium sp.]
MGIERVGLEHHCHANLARLDNVVTCAAIITAKRIPEQDWAHWQRVLGVNLLGTFFTVQGCGAAHAGQSRRWKHCLRGF